MQKKSIAYWGCTGLLALAMTAGGLADLARPDAILTTISKLGYPTYFLTIIGVAKLLGVAAITVPGLPRLKEWAYAGFAIDLIGATWSHLAVGDPPAEVAPAVALLVVTFASWWLRPDDRRL
jgi:hypothetical protein